MKLNPKAAAVTLDEEQQDEMQNLRERFSEMYDYIEKELMNSREKELALTKLEEAQFWVAKAICLG
jgi:hypothetical protein